MISPWMPRGSALKYMKEQSPTPSSAYALDLLNDVVRGLMYLHSVHVVHGDLCGRNILMDEHGRACLADFGLAAFVDLETSIKSSTRSGSTRWMAPELLLPPPNLPFKRTRESDIWALGCVCCEIWSEGAIPFRHFATDTVLVLALSEFTETQRQESPYPDKPHDTGGNPMPDDLWELARSCFQYEPSERPTVDTMADIIGYAAGHGLGSMGTEPVASARGTSTHKALQSSTDRTVEDLNKQPSTPSFYATAKGKNKQPIRFDEEWGTVRFGPFDVIHSPEEPFSTLFKRLSQVVRKDVLVEPLLVEQDDDHLSLRFQGPLEAHNFAMTWMVHRFDPYLQVTAAVVENE
ncbi:Kinase-like protein [Mycena sanguinolenta]|uniref:Kinase-like protein n=1 Tax=Mycena sanguinolenta TaxID=230812 RepID=A0A8H6ZAI3_9AGAR|nr:Kinase-like protein [Mycena sanguinolenta]